MKIVLYQPQIPQNTGNIVRTCAVTGCSLILIPPLGFSIDDKSLKRAGLDYWEGVQVEIKENLQELIEEHFPRIFFLTSKGTNSIFDIEFQPNDLLVFGAETHGLPKEILTKYPELCIKVPMIESARCLNLATTVGIAVYQAFRHFPYELQCDSTK
ncbi:MAG: tRNA (cytidine(34)-2'-O)-methyltransferase [Chlamydiae bacterium]|nr:tRNA (cytidine(34)-2'-O)-methyltransferase [Chlamydiota bacterium]